MRLEMPKSRHSFAMEQPKRILLYLVLALSCNGSNSSNLPKYIASAVRELADRQHGIANVVFLGSHPTGERVLEKVLRMKYVTKTIIKTGILPLNNADLPINPLVLFVQADAGDPPDFLGIMLKIFNPRTPMCVLYSQNVTGYRTLVSSLLYNNVVYLDVEDPCPPPDPRELFETSWKQNLSGIPITYMLRRPLPKGRPELSWVESTASLLNTTASEFVYSCPKSETKLWTRCFGQNFIKNNVSIDLSGYLIIIPVRDKQFMFLTTSLQDDGVLLVPRSPLNIVKLLVLPFRWQVWLTLTILLIVLEVIHLLVPNIFLNEPILMVICGFEKLGLHKTKLREKFIIFPMIVLMFCISNAYESKLVSLMVNRPVRKEIRSFQDLLDSGVRIKNNVLQSPIITNVPGLLQTPEPTNETIFSMDMINGYVAHRRWAEHILPLYYDPDLRMHRYRIMEQSFGKLSITFVLRPRSPLRDAFVYTMNVHIESGIFEYLFKMNVIAELNSKFGARYRLESSRNNPLQFSDLSPAWVILLGGLVAALITFAVEVSIHKLLSVC